jgi:putative SOS response-associated peptidase YedK
MCGRFIQSSETAVLEKRFGLRPGGPVLEPCYNLAPGREAATATADRVLTPMRWGLVPAWSRDAASGYKAFNARAETAADKPSFREPFRRRRCLVPADGFYEWSGRGGAGSGQPWLFRLAGGGPFALAGLWDFWRGPGGEELRSFTIITTRANDLLKPVHQRMPAILAPEDEGAWLDPGLADVRRLQALLRPYPAEAMTGHPVSGLVNSVRNQGAKCTEPSPRQGDLFSQKDGVS